MDVPSFNPFDGIDVDLDPSVPDPHDRECVLCGNTYTPYSMLPDTNTVIRDPARVTPGGKRIAWSHVEEPPPVAPPDPYRCPRCRGDVKRGTPKRPLVVA